MRSKAAKLVCCRLVGDDTGKDHTHASTVWVPRGRDAGAVQPETQQFIYNDVHVALRLIGVGLPRPWYDHGEEKICCAIAVNVIRKVYSKES